MLLALCRHRITHNDSSPELPAIILQANGLIIRAVEPFGDVFKVQSLDKDYDLAKIEVRRDKLDVPELAYFDPKVRK